MKTPLEFVVSRRARDRRRHRATRSRCVQALRELGMPLYGCQPPTGYSMTADAWVNTGALLNRMNFAVQLWRGRTAAAGRPRRSRVGPPVRAGSVAGAVDSAGATARGPARQLGAGSRGRRVALGRLTIALDSATRRRRPTTTRQRRSRAPRRRSSWSRSTLGSPEFQTVDERRR